MLGLNWKLRTREIFLSVGGTPFFASVMMIFQFFASRDLRKNISRRVGTNYLHKSRIRLKNPNT